MCREISKSSCFGHQVEPNSWSVTYPIHSRTKLKIMVKEKIGQVCHLGTPKLTKKDTRRQDVWPNA
jgi:hypothetical protein